MCPAGAGLESGKAAFAAVEASSLVEGDGSAVAAVEGTRPVEVDGLDVAAVERTRLVEADESAVAAGEKTLSAQGEKEAQPERLVRVHSTVDTAVAAAERTHRTWDWNSLEHKREDTARLHSPAAQSYGDTTSAP